MVSLFLVPKRVDIEIFPQWQNPPHRLSFTIRWLPCSGHWQASFNTFSTLAVRGVRCEWAVLWKACFVHTAAVWGWVHLGGQNGRKSKRAFPLRGMERGRGEWAWAGCVTGLSHEKLVTGHCEIYSNFFNYRNANNPPALSFGDQILGRTPPHIQQRGNKIINSFFCVMMTLGEIPHLFLGLIGFLVYIWVWGTS